MSIHRVQCGKPALDSREHAPTYVAWATEWLAAIADGTTPMSQRRLATVEEHGGLAVIMRVAWDLGVHLLQLQDERGETYILASAHPFKVIC